MSNLVQFSRRLFAYAPGTRSVKKYVPPPPRNLNEAIFRTTDHKGMQLKWTSIGYIELTVQDRAHALTYPINLAKYAGCIISSFRDGGLCEMVPSSKAKDISLKVGSDKGMLYFAIRNDGQSITTGLSKDDSRLAYSLIQFAERNRINQFMK